MDKYKRNSLLIVDDEKANIMELNHILSSEYNIRAAKDGRDAIEIANDHTPDVILLDIIMPDMDGYEVITALKGAEKTRDIPVIFISGLNSAKDEEKGLVLGAADYINKPFHSSIVRLRVSNQIRMLNYLRVIEGLSMIDQLTEIPNRRSFDDRLRLEWNRAMRDKMPLSLLFIDIDHFKDYNDTHGHQQGDVALQTVAHVLVHELKRSIDFVARFGGEEFVVLLTNTDMDKALIVAERLRQTIENVQIPLANGHASRITISIGSNSLIPSPDTLTENFVRCADEAMYSAKNSGRNKICPCTTAGGRQGTFISQ